MATRKLRTARQQETLRKLRPVDTEPSKDWLNPPPAAPAKRKRTPMVVAVGIGLLALAAFAVWRGAGL